MVNEPVELEGLHYHLDGTERSRKGSANTVGLADALHALPLESPSFVPIPPAMLSGSRPITTKSFSGVPVEALPAGLTDGMDVILPILLPNPNNCEDEQYVGPIDGRSEAVEYTLPALSPDIPSEIERERRYRRSQRVAMQEAARIWREKETFL
jgi:hypothetical protein